MAEKSRPDRNAFGFATLATRAVARAGPTPGISSSRLLASLDRCQAMIRRFKLKNLGCLSICSWAPSANKDTHVPPRALVFVAPVGSNVEQFLHAVASEPARQSRTQQDERGSH